MKTFYVVVSAIDMAAGIVSYRQGSQGLSLLFFICVALMLPAILRKENSDDEA